MNFLAKKLGTLTGFSIPYNFLDPIAVESVWKVYKGTKVADTAPVTIFEFALKEVGNGRYEGMARNAFKKLKSIRFPGVIQTIDFIENDSYLYVITERVTPLREALAQLLDPEVKLFGLYQVAKTLAFITKEAGCVHGNFGTGTVFVTQLGDWKLAGFEMLTNLTSDPDQPLYRFSLPFEVLQLPEVAQLGFEAVRKAPAKYDAFRLGAFIHELYNGTPPRVGDLGIPGSIPPALVTAYKRLVASFLLRSTPEMFFAAGESSFFHASLIEFDLALAELAYQDPEAKLAFLSRLSAALSGISLFPVGFLEYKVLPGLVDLFNTNTEPANTPLILSPILLLSATLPSSSRAYTDLVKPVIFKAFTLADRATRLQLLTALPHLVSSLTKSDVTDRIFPQLVSGFGDTNETIRGETVKVCTVLAPFLSVRLLNNDLLRLLAKSQMDPEATIRTNTLVVLASVASFLSPSSRPGVLITAFSKGLRDPFTPCKLHALKAFANAIDYFLPEICCTRVLGAITHCLLDKNYRVRDEARTVFEAFMSKINAQAQALPRDPKDAEVVDLEQTELAAKTVESDTTVALMGQSINANMVIATPNESVTLLPEQGNSRLNLTQEIDDGWDFTATQVEPSVATPVRAKPAPAKVLSRPGLKLQAKKAPVSQLKLNVEVDDDGWDEGW